jgi:hypothetical protein
MLEGDEYMLYWEKGCIGKIGGNERTFFAAVLMQQEDSYSYAVPTLKKMRRRWL